MKDQFDAVAVDGLLTKVFKPSVGTMCFAVRTGLAYISAPAFRTLFVYVDAVSLGGACRTK